MTSLSELKAIKEQTTWLQGIGAAYGKPAGDLQVGDTVAWNYGQRSTVTAILKQTAATVTVEFDEKHNMSFKKARIVAISIDGKIKVASVTQAQLSIV